MVVFDPSLDFEPVAEQNNDPVIPEERFTFELIGLERSGPDRWRKNGGIKWTWLVWYPDGRPFYFNDEHYTLFRTTGVNAEGRPVMNIGTYAHDWASAMLGRELGIDEALKVSELRGKKMSAQVVWEKQKEDPKKKSAKLASLRHVPVVGGSAPAPASSRTAPDQVSADPSEEDIDRALLVTKLTKQVQRLTRLDPEAGGKAQEAVDASDLKTASLEAIHVLMNQVQAAIQKAMDD